TGIYDFAKACRKVGIKPIVGMEVRQENRLRYITLAKCRAGIGEICRLVTAHNCDGAELPSRAPAFEEVITVYPMANVPEQLRDNEYIGIRPHEVNRLIRPEWQKWLHRMVIWYPVTVSGKLEHNLHRILRAIDLNVVLSRLSEEDCCRVDEYMRPAGELLAIYGDYPLIVANTARIMEACNFEFDFATPKNKRHYTGNREGDIKLLTGLAYAGLKKRYGEKNRPARERVDKELRVIDELGFSGYFLITWDIVRYSNSMGFMHVGRGSGANSIVAYCLGITDICPLELDLY